MRDVGLMSALLISLMAGLAAALLLGRRWSGLTYLMAGLAGSVLGGYLLRRLDLRFESGLLESIIASVLGAVILLSVLGLLRRAR